MLKTTFITIVVLWALLSFYSGGVLRRRLAQARQALRATEKMCDMDTLLLKWLAEHPGQGVDHPEAQEILQEMIRSHVEFLETHPLLNTTRYHHHLGGMIRLLKEGEMGMDWRTRERYINLAIASAAQEVARSC